MITKQKALSHAPDATVAMIQKIISMIKELWKMAESVPQLLEIDIWKKYKGEFRPYFPAEGAMRRTFQNNKRKGQPALPESLDDVNINGKYNFISPSSKH